MLDVFDSLIKIPMAFPLVDGVELPLYNMFCSGTPQKNINKGFLDFICQFAVVCLGL